MSYRIYRTRTDYLTTEHGEIELPIPDTSECAGWNHKASILPDGRLLVSYLASDDEYRDADDVLGDGVPYVEHRDVADILGNCDNCCNPEAEHPRAEDEYNYACPVFVPTAERQLYDLNRLMPVFVFSNGGQSGMDFRHDSDEWNSASGWLVLADDFTQPTSSLDALVIFDAARNEWKSWANGDIWGIIHATYAPDTATFVDDEDMDVEFRWALLDDLTESCWGYVGHVYAEAEMVAEHNILTTLPVPAVQP